MKGKSDGAVLPNLIIYLLNSLLRYSPWAVVTNGCWEVKWAKRFVRMLPITTLMQHCIGNLCQIKIRHISFKSANHWIKMPRLRRVYLYLCIIDAAWTIEWLKAWLRRGCYSDQTESEGRNTCGVFGVSRRQWLNFSSFLKTEVQSSRVIPVDALKVLVAGVVVPGQILYDTWN